MWQFPKRRTSDLKTILHSCSQPPLRLHVRSTITTPTSPTPPLAIPIFHRARNALIGHWALAESSTTRGPDDNEPRTPPSTLHEQHLRYRQCSHWASHSFFRFEDWPPSRILSNLEIVIGYEVVHWFLEESGIAQVRTPSIVNLEFITYLCSFCSMDHRHCSTLQLWSAQQQLGVLGVCNLR